MRVEGRKEGKKGMGRVGMYDARRREVLRIRVDMEEVVLRVLSTGSLRRNKQNRPLGLQPWLCLS